MPHARVTRIDTSAALAMPGVKAILTADDLPAPADAVNDNGQLILANLDGEVALTNEPVYQGEPILAVAAVDEVTAAEAIEQIEIDFEPLPFVVDPLVSLRPGGPNARTKGNYWFIRRRRRPAAPAAAEPAAPEIREMKWTAGGLRRGRRRAACRCGRRAGRMGVRRSRGRLQGSRARARRDLRHADTSHQTLETRTRDGVLAERQALRLHAARRAPRRPCSASSRWVGVPTRGRRASSASTPAAGSAARSPARSRWRFRRCWRRRPTRR